MPEIYLDHSATTAVLPEAAARAAYMMTECYGNPSSLHTLGLRAEQELQSARTAVAAVVGAPPEALYFTSGGTEANNLAILGGAAAKQRRGRHIVTSQIEHPSVLAACKRLEEQGFEVTYVAPAADGHLEPDTVLEACRADTVLISLMTVNNETGARLELDTLLPQLRRRSPEALLHTDAVQAAGKLPLSVSRLPVDLLSFSGHKLRAPKGVGALYVRKGVRLVPPAALGGGQERGLRSGTEALPAIAAFGEAARHLPAPKEFLAHTERLRTHLQEAAAPLGAVFHRPAGGVPYIVNFSLPGMRSETLLHFLAARGIYVSAGSACAKGHRSHVLSAMKLPDAEITSALRVSFGFENTAAEIDALCEALHEAQTTLFHRA